MANVTDTLPARVFLRPLGAALPLGMSGLLVASFVESGLELHWIANSQASDIGLILIAVPFTVQFLACVLSYLARDGSVGAVLGVLASTWAALGLIHITSIPGSVSGALGLMLLASGGAVSLSAVAVANAKPLPALVFLCAGGRFALAGIYQLTAAAPWQHASGIVGLVVTGLAGYCVLAFELESQLRRAPLPTIRRGRGAAAIDGDVGAQLDGIAHEPGVRQTS